MGIWNRITKPNFWDNVVRQEGDGCWEWKAAYLGKGYGSWRPTPGHRPLGAHRVAYELTHGPIPAGPARLCVCHKCDNPPCVRPDHLFLGTYTANHHDMKSKGRAPVGDKHGRRVLHSGEVADVLTAYARGDVTMRALGARYGVTWGAIRFIVYGITWKDVPGPRLPREQLEAIWRAQRTATLRERNTNRTVFKRSRVAANDAEKDVA